MENAEQEEDHRNGKGGGVVQRKRRRSWKSRAPSKHYPVVGDTAKLELARQQRAIAAAAREQEGG